MPACLQRYPFVVVYNDAKWNLEKRFSDFAELDAALDTYFEKDEDTTVRLTSQCASRARRARMRVLPFRPRLYRARACVSVRLRA